MTESCSNILEQVNGWSQMISDALMASYRLSGRQMETTHFFYNGMLRQMNAFSFPFYTALKALNHLEKKKLEETPLEENIKDYLELLQFNQQIVEKGVHSSISAMHQFHQRHVQKAYSAWICTLSGEGEEDILTYTDKFSKLIRQLVNTYPQAIREIKPEYGFHFDREGYVKIGETSRFFLYQVLPSEKGVCVQERLKPIVIIPPYVLGANILCFLPGENKSYVHAFANQGIPTYIRIMREIDDTPAVQTMTGEEDVLDTAYFCHLVKSLHGCAVTLNGFCQGGFIAVLNLLTGRLDGLVDTLITCVAPIDGTRSHSLTEYLQHIPPRFRDLGYAEKILDNGNKVVDGKVMSWVYKLKSIEREAPLFTFYRDLTMFEKFVENCHKISKTAAAINHWLIYDRTDLPVAVTQLSFDSYTIPMAEDGTMPVKLFGKPLNIKRLKEKQIRFLICCAEKDDLVDKESTLAPLDFMDAEVTTFPKGHGAIATSWSHPESEFALHTVFGNNCRGPVRFQLDMSEPLDS